MYVQIDSLQGFDLIIFSNEGLRNILYLNDCFHLTFSFYIIDFPKSHSSVSYHKLPNLARKANS